jgi:hypothetical protein
MINGYVTYNELKIITGFDDAILKPLIMEGLSQHQLDIEVTYDKRYTRPITEQLFNLKEVEDWISIHIF